MELDRSDNAHTVKRRLQLALNVPTEESSLTYGDMREEGDRAVTDSPSLFLPSSYALSISRKTFTDSL